MRQSTRPVQIWDIPTRLFHWGVVILVATSWLTQHQGWMRLHVLSGYAMATALIFRLIWGIIGSDSARFSHFLKGPLAASRHLAQLLRREPDIEAGHNPAGGWMVLVMLGLLIVQTGTGACANDEISTEGPFAHLVGPAYSDWLSHIHAVNFRLIELVVVAHLVAIATYRITKGHDLVRPMVTGTKYLPVTIQPPRLVGPALAAVVFALSAGLILATMQWFGG